MARALDPRVLTIPAGLPFLKVLAQKLIDGDLAPGYRYDPADPLSLAKVTILVPTRRAARVLRSEFVDLLGGRSAILPVIRPLGETDEDGGFFEVDSPAAFDLLPPVGGTVMLLELSRLVLAWRNQLPEIVRSIHSDTPLVAPASPADAIWLARALIELIEAVETEERDWFDLQKLDSQDFATWWQLTLAFLGIATTFWPARLEELKRSSPHGHRNSLLRSEAARLANTAEGPIIVAGSTGSIPAAADLIAAIARLPQGVVVLPGLDLSMPDADWRNVGADEDARALHDPAGRSHPQYGLSRLLRHLRITRSDVTELAAAPLDLADRAEILSRAMAPASATNGWSVWRSGFGVDRTRRAFGDVALIEAANEREEATAIAIALRLALEKPGAGGDSRAALITPDRNLARRVAAELARFGITADDSAGTPLSATQQGTLMQLLLEAALRPGDPVPVVSLLKHPLARFGFEEAAYCEAVQALEMIALRGGTRSVDIAGLQPLFDARYEEQKTDRHPPQWRLALPDTATAAARELAAAIGAAVEPLTGMLVSRDRHHKLSSKAALAEWARRTGQVLEAVCRGPSGNLASLWSGEAGEKLASLLGEIMEADGQIEADGPQWIDIMAALAAGEAVKPKALRHPRVFIFGTLEARLQSVDTLILGGLNEGSWPGQTTNNPFLSRVMKAEIGLEPPERRIGQLAHDFEMANGTRNVIYSRSLRQGSAPTVASRWLQRLLALGGPELAGDLRERGDRYRHFADLIDRGSEQRPAQRPAPTPPADLQPKKFSFSEVGRLRRDPYAIYGKRVLKLDPLRPFNADPGAAERGTLYHRILECFVREGHAPDADNALQCMLSIADRLFDAENLPTHVDVVWRQRFEEIARAYLAWDAARRPLVRRILTEVPAGVELPAAGIRLSGIADRLDVKTSGGVDIIDYKTGLSPSVAQARSLLDPQLALEAAALMAGGFRQAGPLPPENLIYVRLRPGERFCADLVNNEHSGRSDNKKSATELAEQALGELTRLVTLLRSGERGFVSRLIPAQQNDFGGEYDHLARVAEWSTAEGEESSYDE
ncbi:ATP-dependent helicase/nuclease subunit B [Ciceribacter lividus]|uniref:ATP-dependent helicase/nuclease subunit B n=1 Tax=Ciceribacter lividus TaxID=1197950 RepID=A0A6I7HJ57_9HYPH|nr:double-strand break repair protein AddB [Ciceribacter lividus]RCW20397.1 ATP-dependent helicase/nuclease subunit B [Ciceribacter lividus]